MCLRRGRLLTHQYDDAIFRSCVAILRLSVNKTNPKKGNTNSIKLSGWQVNIRWCHMRQILSRDEKGASLMDTTRWLNFRLSHVLTFSDKVVKILHTYSCLQKQNVVNMASQRHENQIWKKFREDIMQNGLIMLLKLVTCGVPCLSCVSTAFQEHIWPTEWIHHRSHPPGWKGDWIRGQYGKSF